MLETEKTFQGLEELVEADLAGIFSETLTYGLVLSGNLRDFMALRKFIKDRGQPHVIYQKITPQRLIIMPVKRGDSE